MEAPYTLAAVWITAGIVVSELAQGRPIRRWIRIILIRFPHDVAHGAPGRGELYRHGFGSTGRGQPPVTAHRPVHNVTAQLIDPIRVIPAFAVGGARVTTDVFQVRPP